MKMNPINLGARFILEMFALVAMGVWGWSVGSGIFQYVLAIVIPVIAAATWGTFNVLNDPSRSGKAPVEVPGALRLIIELLFFSVATWMLYALGYTSIGIGFAIAIVIHYSASYERVEWLLAR